MKRPNNPKQLVDKICKIFLKSLTKAAKANSEIIDFKATGVFKSQKVQQSHEHKGNQNIYRMWVREARINEKIGDLA